MRSKRSFGIAEIGARAAKQKSAACQLHLAAGRPSGLSTDAVAEMADDEKAKRVKNLLSLYYANDAAPGGGDAGQRKVTAIDSAAFDAEAYVANLVCISLDPRQPDHLVSHPTP